DGHPWQEPRVLSKSKANDWSPAIAADGKGNVYVAYDTYDQGNYDVLLAAVNNRESRTITVATSAKFEARPHLACDAQGRVWIAYEEGDEQWGKDYAHAGNVSNVGLEKNPGFALYVNRTVRVKCLADGQLLEPAGDLGQAFAASPLRRNKSLPRLAVDASGGGWLLVRHHLVPGAARAARAALAAVRAHEAEDVGRVRGARVEVGGKKLHLLRGEFHRHTEYTAHNDQDGLLEDAWRYGLDAAGLDWIGVGDHDNG